MGGVEAQACFCIKAVSHITQEAASSIVKACTLCDAVVLLNSPARIEASTGK